MKLRFTYLLTVATGVGLFSAVAYLVLVLPALRAPVFLLGSSWWLWTVWRYASAQERTRTPISVAASDTDDAPQSPGNN